MKTILHLSLLLFIVATCMAVDPAPSTLQNSRQTEMERKLKAEQEVLLGLLMKYTEQHPIVTAQREKILDLEKRLEVYRTKISDQLPHQYQEKAELVAQLSAAYERLQHLATRYSEAHPLVLKQHDKIKSLEQQLGSLLQQSGKK